MAPEPIEIQPMEIEKDYERAVEWLNRLLDAMMGDKSHPLAPLVDTLSDRIADYEDVHYPMGQNAGPIGTIRFLLDQHGLKQKDLAEIFGSTGVVSEIMSGKRQLNKRHIEQLSKRFSVSPSVFF